MELSGKKSFRSVCFIFLCGPAGLFQPKHITAASKGESGRQQEEFL